MRLRLLKVIVQPILVVQDDDGNLSELSPQPQPIEVPAVKWPTYATDEFEREFDQLKRQIETD